MSKRTTVILVLAVLLLLSIGCNIYQSRVATLMNIQRSQSRTIDSLQLAVYEAAIQTLTQRTTELQRAYLEQKDRYFALKVNSTDTKGKTDKELADILRKKLGNIPMGGQ